MPGDPPRVRVGMIDGPVELPGVAVSKGQNFSDAGAGAAKSSVLAHGNGVARLIGASREGIDLYVARVFGDTLVCRPEQVAAALDWLLQQGVQLINMSFGLRTDRAMLRDCCAQAVTRGHCLVAASPAQGQGVYPSLYPGIVRATGDARCRPGEIAWLDSAQADFGGYPGRPGDALAGASAGCASVTGTLAGVALANPGLEPAQWLQRLEQRADYRGPERRGASST
jgi:hypothetical protein